KNYLAPLNFNTPDRTSNGLCRDWRSGNKVIDDLIQVIRLQYPHPAHNLNWIPYEEFADCEHISDGGFSTIYKATWTTSANWDLFSQPQFLHCHGITQSSSSGDFIMVMQYAKSGDLRLYLQPDITSNVLLQKDGLASAHNNISTNPTHPDAVYHSRLLDFPELRGTTRRRQYLSLNIPRSVPEGSSNDTIQLSQQPTQPSQDNPKHLLLSGNISNSSKPFRNTYNHPPTHKDASRDAQVNSKINPRAINPRVKPNVISVFIPDDDIETLQKYWAMDSMSFNLKKIANYSST
ncbi:2369_t:CDS:2, partial [Scutellospora calospora]